MPALERVSRKAAAQIRSFISAVILDGGEPNILQGDVRESHTMMYKIFSIGDF
jgi:hypothetical protein